MSDSIIIVGVGIKYEHWREGYHHDRRASSRIQEYPVGRVSGESLQVIANLFASAAVSRPTIFKKTLVTRIALLTGGLDTGQRFDFAAQQTRGCAQRENRPYSTTEDLSNVFFQEQ